MLRDVAVGFAAGVVVTVAVGQAILGPAVRPTTKVAEDPNQAPPQRPDLAPDGGPSASPEDVTARLHALEDAIGELTFERDVLRGQLATFAGPSEWPDDLAPELRPDAFEASVRRAFEETVEVAVVDCERYPCVGLFDAGTGDPMAIATTLLDTARAYAKELEGGPAST